MTYVHKYHNDPMPDWQSDHQYQLYEVIDADVEILGLKSNRYMCKVAGKSDHSGSGPVGTGDTIVDGQAVWQWLGPAIIVITKDDGTNPYDPTSNPSGTSDQYPLSYVMFTYRPESGPPYLPTDPQYLKVTPADQIFPPSGPSSTAPGTYAQWVVRFG